VGETAAFSRRNGAPGLGARLAAGLRAQALADLNRWPLWLPFVLGAGAGLYFALQFEPGGFWVALILGFSGSAVQGAILARSSRVRIACAFLAALALGFGAAKLRTESMRTPVLAREIGPVGFDARVVTAEPRGEGSRMVVEPLPIRRLHGATPVRLRLSVRHEDGVPEPGSWVHLYAKLRPPPPPVMPGDFDFGRWAYFQKIGGLGYVYGRPAIAAPRPERRDEAVMAALERLRNRMTARVRGVIPGHNGVIAAALITGERADVDPGDQDAFRDSGLMHVLSISGLHLALAGGVFFWIIRALFALFPSIVLRYPVKKWAALAALAGATFYLLISGCEAPAVRSWVMLSLMFAAVLFDRPALSMRAVAAAAAIVLLITPENIADPGCEMSFAAVIGLIALAEWQTAWSAAHPGGEKTLLRRGWHYLGGILVTSIIATLATAPIAIFHFDRASPFGLIANLAALPVVGVVIMPAAVAAMVAMPFGLDYWPLVVMGKGVAVMMAIAHWVAALPGAGTVVPTWPAWCVAAVMGGGLWIALWRQSWRWLGLLPIAVGLVFALTARPADLLVARDGQTVAVRLAGGRLGFIGKVTDDFAAVSWLRRDGDERLPENAAGGPGVRCDGYGCLIKAQGGVLVAVDRRAEALAEDCAHASVVVSLTAPPSCKGPDLVITRRDVARFGATAVWFGERMRVRTVQGERGERPWSLPVAKRRPLNTF
jgi:competence protein ComEC